MVLNGELAVEIYEHKVRAFAPKSFKTCLQASLRTTMRGESVKIAKKYGVTPKAIRDIWNHKSWVKATNQIHGATIKPTLAVGQKFTADGTNWGCFAIDKAQLLLNNQRENIAQLVQSPEPGNLSRKYCESTSVPSLQQTIIALESNCMKSYDVGWTFYASTFPAKSAYCLSDVASQLSSSQLENELETQSFAAACQDDPFHNDWPHW